MITLQEADDLLREHLGETHRARHSRFVAHAMAGLADALGADPVTWRIVGLCHDLDFEVTAHDRSQHGLVAAGWLAGRLPPYALEAIAAHDHRTLVQADTPIADMLKLADVLALLDEHAGREHIELLDQPDGHERLRERLGGRPYLIPMLAELSRKHGLQRAQLVAICESGPSQRA